MLEPADPLEPEEIIISICNDCKQHSEQCECENPSGFTEDWGFKCPDCHLEFVTGEEWSNHPCEGYDFGPDF